jgi:hypothetical protein
MLNPSPREMAVEYQVSKLLQDRGPAGRVFVSGGTRFRINSWFAVPQLGGTFESGLRNRIPLDLMYHMRLGLGRTEQQQAPDAIRSMRFAGVEYAVLHGPDSSEHYKDFKRPDMFDGLLERVYARNGDFIYKVPFHGYAHLVYDDEMTASNPSGYDVELSTRYVASMDDPVRPKLASKWLDNNRLEIRGRMVDGMGVSVQVNYDEGWTAAQNGKPLQVLKDNTNFILLRPQPGESMILLHYTGSPEHKRYAALSGAAWLIALGWLVIDRRRRTR